MNTHETLLTYACRHKNPYINIYTYKDIDKMKLINVQIYPHMIEICGKLDKLNTYSEKQSLAEEV